MFIAKRVFLVFLILNNINFRLIFLMITLIIAIITLIPRLYIYLIIKKRILKPPLTFLLSLAPLSFLSLSPCTALLPLLPHRKAHTDHKQTHPLHRLLGQIRAHLNEEFTQYLVAGKFGRGWFGLLKEVLVA
jgi:hypothetical protein